MDHFQSLEPYSYREQPLVPIRWLGFDHERHPVCSFTEYPTQRGWNPSAIQKLKSNQVDATFCSETLPMLQSWLFVGALEAISKRRQQVSDFLRIRHKQQIVSTRFLSQFFKTWRDSLGMLSVQEKEGRAQEISEILSEMQFWCFKLGNWQENETDVRRGGSVGVGQPPDGVDDVCVLLTLVGETINTERTFMMESRALRRGFKGCYTAESENRLTHRLVAHGCCPFMARILFTFRYSVAQYALYFHMREPSWRTHAACTPLRCVAYMVDTATYQPRHTVARCNCSYIKPPLEGVTSLLKRGKIPVIMIIGEKDVSDEDLARSNFELGVADSNAVKSLSGYVAFSHVWSDGMGSTTEKGLPRCLVTDLFLRAYALGIRHLWIDSLCVPEENEARIQAIILMNPTYKYSAATIVLDSHIRQKRFNCQSTPLELILLVLITSPWMQRLWTLPEAVLPRLLIFQFQNVLASSRDIYDAVIECFQQHLFNPVIQSFSIELFRILKQTDNSILEPERELDLAEMLRMLRLRSTSRVSDEVVAIADLFDLDVTPLLAVKSDLEEQRKRFFHSLGRIPSDIIFTSTPRMTSHGFRWAPLSFLMSDQTPDIKDSCATGNRTRFSQCLGNGGLCGKYQVVRLSRTAQLMSLVSVVLQYGHELKKVVNASRETGRVEFDALAMLPGIETLRSLRIAVALMHVGTSRAGLPEYEYRGRLLVGDIEVWPSEAADCIGLCNPFNEECVEIILL
ncbi:hypothetical protein HD806DRAFT_459489 [Xylariaceae sp. AK1471]|nr:hypothetical protein HD806DRAFT_459489 [Xylariaceae sp. AK1471]